MDQKWKNSDEKYNRKSARDIGFFFAPLIYGRVFGFATRTKPIHSIGIISNE